MRDEAKVSLVTAICILTLAVIPKYFLNVQLDFITQYGPVWVYIAYIITKDKAKKSKYWSLAIIFATIAILVLYSL